MLDYLCIDGCRLGFGVSYNLHVQVLLKELLFGVMGWRGIEKVKFHTAGEVQKYVLHLSKSRKSPEVRHAIEYRGFVCSPPSP